MYKNLLGAFLCIFIQKISFSQGICSDPSFAKGDFDLSATTLCVPGRITITDKSGGTNIKYVYDYKGESFDMANASSVNTTNNSYTQYSKPTEVTVLQIGKINGKPSVACKNITLRTGTTPIYSYSVCEPNTIEINIPTKALNNYDSYIVNLGPGQPPIAVNSSQLPYTVRRALSLPRSISVTGTYSDATKNCPATGASKVIIPIGFTITGINREFNANISRIELTTPASAKLTFDGAFSSDAKNPYKLYMYAKGTPPSITPLINSIEPGIINVTIPDSTRSYCFYAQRDGLCSSSRERSPEICTHPLYKMDFVAAPNRYNLSWDNYPNIPFSSNNLLFLGILINYNKELIRITNGTKSTFVRNATTTTYTDPLINCKNKYCYQVVHSASGMYSSIAFTGVSISNIKCDERSKIVAPKPTDAYVSTTIDNNNLVTMRYAVPSYTLRREQFNLFKQDGSKFTKIDSLVIPNPGALPATITLNDKSLVSKPETYKIGYRDECNSESALSDEMKSVYLKYELPDMVSWTNGVPFINRNANRDITNFELIPLDEATKMPLTAAVQAKTIFNTRANLDPFNKFAYFRLKINSTIYPTEQKYSNTIAIPITPSIFLPTAFSPNGDSQNDDLIFKGKTGRLSDFNFRLYSRNGEQLLEIKDLSTKWDGIINGRQIPMGSYIYKITSKIDDGTNYDKNGMLEIMR